MADLEVKRNKKKGILGIAANFNWSWQVGFKILAIGLSFTIGFTSSKVYQSYVTQTEVAVHEQELSPPLHIDRMVDEEPEGGIEVVAWPVEGGKIEVGLLLPEALQDTVIINRPLLLIVNMPEETEFSPSRIPVSIGEKRPPPITYGWGVDPRREGRAWKKQGRSVQR